MGRRVAEFCGLSGEHLVSAATGAADTTDERARATTSAKRVRAGRPLLRAATRSTRSCRANAHADDRRLDGGWLVSLFSGYGEAPRRLNTQRSPFPAMATSLAPAGSTLAANFSPSTAAAANSAISSLNCRRWILRLRVGAKPIAQRTNAPVKSLPSTCRAAWRRQERRLLGESTWPPVAAFNTLSPGAQSRKNVSVAGADSFAASSTAITSTVLNSPKFP
jgi:hypothetical protein